MKKSVINLLDEASKKMSGYAALLNYRFMNLSVMARPEALLSVTVMVDGEGLPIEKVAQARNAPDHEEQFEIYPNSKELLYAIVKGLKEAHPEYKVDIKTVEGDGEENDEDAPRYILATMPEVDDNRHDVLTQAVDWLAKATDVQIEATFTTYTAKIASKLEGAQAEDIDEAKNALQELHDRHKDLCEQFKSEKEKEIEAAYKAWQDGQTREEAAKQEFDAAHNLQAGLQMNLSPEDE